MVGLEIAGVLDRCETFQNSLDLGAVRRLSAKNENDRTFLLELLRELSTNASFDNARLEQALRDALGRSVESPLVHSAQDVMRSTVERKHASAADLATILAKGEVIIVVDENKMVGNLLPDLQVFPFPERDGRYNGPPADSEVAIRELERLRGRGAHFIVFMWPSLWWLEHYDDLNEFLRDNYRCVLHNERLVVFDLRAGGSSANNRDTQIVEHTTRPTN
jgi:hypothetical protein